MTPIPLDDPADPRIEAYRDVRDRDLKGRGGRFMIEGEIVLRAALAPGRFALESVLVAGGRLGPAAALLDRVPVYAAARPVLDAIAGFPLHRGVLAVGLRGEDPRPETLLAGLPEAALVMALCGIANHDNVGGLFRNAAAFGADAVLLDEGCCDPLYRKALRVSAGAALAVPFAQGGTGQALCAMLEAAGFTVFATGPRGAERLDDAVPAARTAVLFGAEGPGLAPALLARLRTLRIDMAGGFDSLNVATTSGIVLHRLSAARRRMAAASERATPPPAGG